MSFSLLGSHQHGVSSEHQDLEWRDGEEKALEATVVVWSLPQAQGAAFHTHRAGLAWVIPPHLRS